MAWVQIFPLGNTLISDSVAQFQDNWLTLQTDINADHYFNSLDANEGHHRFAKLITQTLDVVPAGVIASLALYAKNNAAGNPKLYSNTASGGVTQVNTWDYALVNGSGTFGVLNMTGAQNVTAGMIFVAENGGASNYAGGYFNYDGTVVRFTQMFFANTGGGADLTSIQVGGAGNKFITITTANGNHNWDVIVMRMQI